MRLDQEAAAEAQRKREAEEAERLAQQQEEARLKAEQDAEIKKQGEQTMVLFEQEAALAETVTAPEANECNHHNQWAWSTFTQCQSINHLGWTEPCIVIHRTLIHIR